MIAALAGVSFSAHAQSADALLDKLVDKGILTVKEANELREEADKGFTSAHQVKSGMPDWVTSFKLNGDVRGRYDGIYMPDLEPGLEDSSARGTFLDRHRFRYRLRFGAVAVMKENFEAGFRLTSSEPRNVGSPITDTQGGDPISGNTSFGDNGSKKFVYIDLAYGRWYAMNTPDFSVTATVGKMENPFVVSEMMFDGDYTPEGAALNIGYNINDAQSLKLNIGGFMLDESGGRNGDPYFVGSQLRHDGAWTPKWATTAGVGVFVLSNTHALSDTAVPNVQRGNTRVGGNLVEDFTTWYADAAVTYNLDRAPMYNAAFPIRVGGEYLRNEAADNYNKGYAAGVTFGKAGKKGLWEVSYKWKELQGDVWYEEFVDSDFGAVYQAAYTPIGTSTGYLTGTNLRGHVIRAQYSLSDSFTLAGTVYLASIHRKEAGTTGGIAIPGNYDSSTMRVQLDAIWKF